MEPKIYFVFCNVRAFEITYDSYLNQFLIYCKSDYTITRLPDPKNLFLGMSHDFRSGVTIMYL